MKSVRLLSRLIKNGNYSLSRGIINQVTQVDGHVSLGGLDYEGPGKVDVTEELSVNGDLTAISTTFRDNVTVNGKATIDSSTFNKDFLVNGPLKAQYSQFKKLCLSPISVEFNKCNIGELVFNRSKFFQNTAPTSIRLVDTTVDSITTLKNAGNLRVVLAGNSKINSKVDDNTEVVNEKEELANRPKV